MIAQGKSLYLDPEKYLELENQHLVKHEYINGQIYAMAGASDAHVTIAGNIFALLLAHLRGGGCRVFISDMKVRLESLNRFYYPDVMVTCDARDRETSVYKRFPCLIIEVLSDSTEAFDRGDKFADYQTLGSLQEYVLVNTKKQRIECFRRNDGSLWLLQSYTALASKFELKSVNFEGTLPDLYQEVVLEGSQIVP